MKKLKILHGRKHYDENISANVHHSYDHELYWTNKRRGAIYIEKI